MSTEGTFSDLQLVEQYLSIRDWIKAETEAQELRLAPAHAAMKAIAGELHGRLIERFGSDKGKKNGSCDAGTFYTTNTLSVRVTDQAAFKEYVFTNNLRDAIAASATKDHVEQYLEAYKTPPPGVEATWVENINVRKS